jgi:hypothetical protein
LSVTGHRLESIEKEEELTTNDSNEHR